MPAEAAQFCADGRAFSAACAEQQALVEAGASFLTPDDNDYPLRLSGDLRSSGGALGARQHAGTEPGWARGWWELGIRARMVPGWRRC